MSTLAKNFSFENLETTNFPIPDFFSQDLGNSIIEHFGDHRNRLFPPEQTICGMLYQAMNNASMSSAIAHLNAQRTANNQKPTSLNTASFSNAKKKSLALFLHTFPQACVTN